MVTAKVNAPNYQAYDPTDLEKVFAQQMFTNPDLGGSAWAMLMHGGLDRQRGIDRYTQDLANSNALQVALAKQEMQNEMSQTALKELAPMANAGLPLANIPLAAQLSSTGFSDPQSASASSTVIQKRQAEIAHLLAQAAASNAAGQPQTTVQYAIGPDGRVGPAIVTGKGRGDIVTPATAATARIAYGMYGAPRVANSPFIFQQPNAVQNRQIQIGQGEGGTLTFK